MNNLCQSCIFFLEPDTQYPFGACVFIQRFSKNLNIDPVNLEFHGTKGCDKWREKPLRDKIPLPAPINDNDAPF